MTDAVPPPLPGAAVRVTQRAAENDHPVQAHYTVDPRKVAVLRRNYDDGLYFRNMNSVENRRAIELEFMNPSRQHILSIRRAVGLDS